MNREQIIRMAREAEHLVIEDYYTNGPVRAFSEAQLERFAALVASAERSACAKVCEEMRTYVDRNNAVTQASANECATAIRARGPKPPDSI